MDEAFYKPARRGQTDELPLFDAGEVAPRKAPRTEFYEVPVRTRMGVCRGCDAIIYWIKAPVSGAALPVDCDVPAGKTPTAAEPGRGVSHFLTCPERDQFSRHKPAAK